MKTHDAAVEGDAGQVVAGNSVQKGATANSHLSNVITINNGESSAPDGAITGLQSRRIAMTSGSEQCAGCAAVALDLQRTRTAMWIMAFGLAGTMAAAGYVIYARALSAGAPAACHHDGKAYTVGGMVRMPTKGIYECSMSPDSGGALQWTPTTNTSSGVKRR